MAPEEAARALQDLEKHAAIGWRGASAEARPEAALRELVAELTMSEGDQYELIVSLHDRLSQILFLTLCQRYGVIVVRKKGQRRTTYVARGPETFVEKVLYPLFEKELAVLVRAMDAWLHSVLGGDVQDQGSDEL